MVSLAGKTLGKYRLIEQLGRGGFASVYKAYQARLDRYVAIKVLHPHLVEGEDFLARFEREAKAVAGLRHPNIVIVHDFDVQENNYFMVMEHIDGQSLKQRLEDLNRQGRHLSLAEVNRIMADITNALDYAHQQGMLHRDIKPSNVLLNVAGQAFLTDFGIARILSQTQFTATGALVGTPAYMSPEQGQGLKVSPASDVYSLGIMLYEFLTGHVPYDADTPLAIIFKHIRDPLPALHSIRPDLPAGLEKVVYKALAKDPEDRFQRAAEMMQALQAIFEQDFQAETLLSRPDSAAIPPVLEGVDQDQAETEAAVQPPSSSADAESLGAFAGVAVEPEPEQASPTPEVEPATVTETVGQPPPIDLAGEPEPMDQKSTVVADDRVPESAQAATLAVDSRVEGTQVEQQQPVQPPVHKPALAKPTKVGPFTLRSWIIAGAVLVGIVGLVFILLSLFRPQASGVPTQAALAATRIMAPTQASVPTEPQPPTEVPGLAQFEQGVFLLNHNQDYLGALEMFNHAEELGFESPDLFGNRARACYQLQLSQERCSFEQAIQDYTRAIELDPDQAQFFDGRSWAYYQTQQWPLAIDDISRAIELDPQNPDFWINRGEIFGRIENFDQAIADFTHAIEIKPDFARAYESRGSAFRIIADWGAALEDFNRAIELDPENPDFWISRGRIHLEIGHFEDAISDFTQALAINPGAIPAYPARAEAYTQLGDVEAALHDMDMAIDLAPEDDRLFIQKAHIFWWQMGEYEAALEALDYALVLNPRSWEAYTNRGEIYAYELGNPELALENFDQGVSTAPPNIDGPFFARGVFLKEIENWPAAMEDLSMAIRINPDGPDAYGHRGDVFRQLGDQDAARADFHRFLELTQENPEYESWRAEIETWLAQNP